MVPRLIQDNNYCELISMLQEFPFFSEGELSTK